MQHWTRGLFPAGLVLLLLTTLGCEWPRPRPPAPVPKPEPAPLTPAAEPFKTYPIESFARTLKLRGLSFSADSEKVLFASDESGVFNAYLVMADGSARRQLTNSAADSSLTLACFPGDDRVLYMSDRGGAENHHLYVLQPDGALRSITTGDDTRETFHSFTHDLKSMFTISNQRDRRVFDLYLRDLTDYSPRMVFANFPDRPLVIGPVSRDRKLLALYRVEGNDTTRVFINDLTTGANREVLRGKAARRYPQFFSPDAKSLYFTSDQDHDFLHLDRLDLAGGPVETVEKTDWDVESAWLSRQGGIMAVLINQDGRDQYQLRDFTTNTPIVIPVLPQGEISGLTISPDDSRIAFLYGTDVEPPSLHVYDLAAGLDRALVPAMNPEIDPQHLVHSRLVRFPARDGLTIPAYLYLPLQASETKKVPAVIWVHGGPGGQSRGGYNSGFQILANQGYAVLAVNNRGSSGYGKAFYHADDRRHGHEPLDDCVDAKRWLQTQPGIDGERIAIMGRSYGGYMVLAALAFRPDEFAAGVDIFGVSNWVRTLESMPPYWSVIRDRLFQEIGDPAQDREMLESISPRFHAENIVRPLLVIQGENDVRVIRAESDEIVAAVRAQGGIVEYLVIPGEGHGFAKMDSEISIWRTILAFLDRHLKGIEPAPEGFLPGRTPMAQ